MTLRPVRLSDPEVQPLLVGLAAEYQLRYGSGDEMAAAKADQFTRPDGAFLVVVDGSQTVAGGGIRRWSDDTCELKRMWTASAQRRRGHASAVLAGLERAARELGYTFIRAETGPAQPEAISLYRRRGYGDIPNYGPYEGSLAFEKRLDVETDG